MRRLAIVALLCLAAPGLAWAGFTETLPMGTFLVDCAFMLSSLDSRWDDDGKKAPLIDPVIRYEPGGGLQGVLTPEAEVQFGVLAPQLQYGILDSLSLGVGVPIVLWTEVDPQLKWESGDYQNQLGRPYSSDDFWDWAGSMGQPKPGPWRGNEGVLGDVQLGARFRFTDYLPGFDRIDAAMALMVMGALPTGRQPDPELLVAAGTTSWDLHSNGDVGVHLSFDKFFKESLDGRLTLGLDGFYEWLLPHTYTSATGEENPLLLTNRPYVGKHYVIDGGDFAGGSAQIDVVPWKGPALATWLVQHDPAKAATLPPLLTLSFRYTYVNLQQTDWQSESELWDWDREKLWRPGYKNQLMGQMIVSLLRVGAPLQPYVAYRNQTWIPGRNARAADVATFGLRAPLKFW